MARFFSYFAILFGFGIALDQLPELESLHLFIAFHFASFLAIAYVAQYQLSRFDTVLQGMVYLIGLYLAWRVSYFPAIVLAGTASSYIEWLLELQTGLPIWIYPSLLIFIALIHGIVAYTVGLMLQGVWVIYLPALAFGLLACMISLNTPHDLRWLPDTNWDAPSKLTVRKPMANPYHFSSPLPLSVAQKTLRFAGGVLYEIIPNTRWSGAIKGILEQAYRENPASSTQTRLQEHYAALLAAHALIPKWYAN